MPQPLLPALSEQNRCQFLDLSACSVYFMRWLIDSHRDHLAIGALIVDHDQSHQIGGQDAQSRCANLRSAGEQKALIAALWATLALALLSLRLLALLVLQRSSNRCNY